MPGHGSIARGTEAALERLRRDLGYLEALEAGARAARREGLAPEAARARLADLEYPGRSAAVDPNAAIHLENIRFAWEAPTERPDARARKR